MRRGIHRHRHRHRHHHLIKDGDGDGDGDGRCEMRDARGVVDLALGVFSTQ